MNKNDIALRKLQKINYAKLPEGISNIQSSFKLVVRRFVTDVDGTIQDKSWLPAFAQKKYPVWLFGNFDEAGGYYNGTKLFPLDAGLFYLYTQTVGRNFNLLNFSGANNIKDQLEIGDQVNVFSDSKQFPNFFVWIVITSERRSYASILRNPLNIGMDVFYMKLIVDNQAQFNEVWKLTKFNPIGDYNTDELSPLTYKTVDYQQQLLIDIPFKFAINNYHGLYMYMNFESDAFEIIFRYIKAKAKMNLIENNN